MGLLSIIGTGAALLNYKKAKQEYETVKKVVNTCNWQHVNDDGWSGRLSIYCKELEEK